MRGGKGKEASAASFPPIMKQIIAILMASLLAFSLTACRNSEPNTPPATTSPETGSSSPAPDSPAATKPEEVPSGIQDDGIGDDPMHGEGIGEVIALSEDEKASVLSHSAYTWLELPQNQKDDLVVLMGRWLEDSSGYIVED